MSSSDICQPLDQALVESFSCNLSPWHGLHETMRRKQDKQDGWYVELFFLVWLTKSSPRV